MPTENTPQGNSPYEYIDPIQEFRNVATNEPYTSDLSQAEQLMANRLMQQTLNDGSEGSQIAQGLASQADIDDNWINSRDQEESVLARAATTGLDFGSGAYDIGAGAIKTPAAIYNEFKLANVNGADLAKYDSIEAKKQANAPVSDEELNWLSQSDEAKSIKDYQASNSFIDGIKASQDAFSSLTADNEMDAHTKGIASAYAASNVINTFANHGVFAGFGALTHTLEAFGDNVSLFDIQRGIAQSAPAVIALGTGDPVALSALSVGSATNTYLDNLNAFRDAHGRDATGKERAGLAAASTMSTFLDLIGDELLLPESKIASNFMMAYNQSHGLARNIITNAAKYAANTGTKLGTNIVGEGLIGSAASDAVNQLATTGEVDPDKLVASGIQGAVQGGVMGPALNSLAIASHLVKTGAKAVNNAKQHPVVQAINRISPQFKTEDEAIDAAKQTVAERAANITPEDTSADDVARMVYHTMADGTEHGTPISPVPFSQPLAEALPNIYKGIVTQYLGHEPSAEELDQFATENPNLDLLGAGGSTHRKTLLNSYLDAQNDFHNALNENGDVDSTAAREAYNTFKEFHDNFTNGIRTANQSGNLSDLLQLVNNDVLELVNGPDSLMRAAQAQFDTATQEDLDIVKQAAEDGENINEGDEGKVVEATRRVLNTLGTNNISDKELEAFIKQQAHIFNRLQGSTDTKAQTVVKNSTDLIDSLNTVKLRRSAAQVTNNVLKGEEGFKGLAEYLTDAATAVKDNKPGPDTAKAIADATSGMAKWRNQRNSKLQAFRDAVKTARDTGKTTKVDGQEFTLKDGDPRGALSVIKRMNQENAAFDSSIQQLKELSQAAGLDFDFDKFMVDDGEVKGNITNYFKTTSNANPLIHAMISTSTPEQLSNYFRSAITESFADVSPENLTKLRNEAIAEASGDELGTADIVEDDDYTEAVTEEATVAEDTTETPDTATYEPTKSNKDFTNPSEATTAVEFDTELDGHTYRLPIQAPEHTSTGLNIVTPLSTLIDNKDAIPAGLQDSFTVSNRAITNTPITGLPNKAYNAINIGSWAISQLQQYGRKLKGKDESSYPDGSYTLVGALTGKNVLGKSDDGNAQLPKRDRNPYSSNDVITLANMVNPNYVKQSDIPEGGLPLGTNNNYFNPSALTRQDLRLVRDAGSTMILPGVSNGQAKWFASNLLGKNSDYVAIPQKLNGNTVQVLVPASEASNYTPNATIGETSTNTPVTDTSPVEAVIDDATDIVETSDYYTDFADYIDSLAATEGTTEDADLAVDLGDTVDVPETLTTANNTVESNVQNSRTLSNGMVIESADSRRSEPKGDVTDNLVQPAITDEVKAAAAQAGETPATTVYKRTNWFAGLMNLSPSSVAAGILSKLIEEDGLNSNETTFITSVMKPINDSLTKVTNGYIKKSIFNSTFENFSTNPFAHLLQMDTSELGYSIPDDIKQALSFGLSTFTLNQLEGATAGKSSADLANMYSLDQDTLATIDGVTKYLMSIGGVPRHRIRDAIGEHMLRASGFKPSAAMTDVEVSHSQALLGDIGLGVLADKGLIRIDSQRDIAKGIQATNPNISDELINQWASLNNSKSTNPDYVMLNSDWADKVDGLKDLKTRPMPTLNKLGAKARPLPHSEPQEVNEQIKRSTQIVSKGYKKGLEAAQKAEWRLSQTGISMVSSLIPDAFGIPEVTDKEAFLANFGYTFPDELAGMTTYNRIKAEGKNNQLMTDLDNYLEFYNELAANDTPVHEQGFYHTYEVLGNTRAQVAERLNYQASKLHRALYSLEAGKIHNDAPKETHDHVLLAVAQGLGLDVDKQANVKTLNQVKELLNSDYYGPVIDDLRLFAEGNKQLSGESLARFNQAVKYDQNGKQRGEPEHAFQVLMEYGNYLSWLNQDESTRGPLATNMFYEIDGKTNGPHHITSHLLTTLDDARIQRLANGNLFIGSQNLDGHTETGNATGSNKLDNYHTNGLNASVQVQTTIDSFDTNTAPENLAESTNLTQAVLNPIVDSINLLSEVGADTQQFFRNVARINKTGPLPLKKLDREGNYSNVSPLLSYMTGASGLINRYMGDFYDVHTGEVRRSVVKDRTIQQGYGAGQDANDRTDIQHMIDHWHNEAEKVYQELGKAETESEYEALYNAYADLLRDYTMLTMRAEVKHNKVTRSDGNTFYKSTVELTNSLKRLTNPNFYLGLPSSNVKDLHERIDLFRQSIDRFTFSENDKNRLQANYADVFGAPLDAGVGSMFQDSKEYTGAFNNIINAVWPTLVRNINEQYEQYRSELIETGKLAEGRELTKKQTQGFYKSVAKFIPLTETAVSTKGRASTYFSPLAFTKKQTPELLALNGELPVSSVRTVPGVGKSAVQQSNTSRGNVDTISVRIPLAANISMDAYMQYRAAQEGFIGGNVYDAINAAIGTDLRNVNRSMNTSEIELLKDYSLSDALMDTVQRSMSAIPGLSDAINDNNFSQVGDLLGLNLRDQTGFLQSYAVLRANQRKINATRAQLLATPFSCGQYAGVDGGSVNNVGSLNEMGNLNQQLTKANMDVFNRVVQKLTAGPEDSVTDFHKKLLNKHRDFIASVPVNYVEPSVLNTKGALAEFVPHEGGMTINIRKGLTPAQELQSYIHEMVHAITYGAIEAYTNNMDASKIGHDNRTKGKWHTGEKVEDNIGSYTADDINSIRTVHGILNQITQLDSLGRFKLQDQLGDDNNLVLHLQDYLKSQTSFNQLVNPSTEQIQDFRNETLSAIAELFSYGLSEQAYRLNEDQATADVLGFKVNGALRRTLTRLKNFALTIAGVFTDKFTKPSDIKDSTTTLFDALGAVTFAMTPDTKLTQVMGTVSPTYIQQSPVEQANTIQPTNILNTMGSNHTMGWADLVDKITNPVTESNLRVLVRTLTPKLDAALSKHYVDTSGVMGPEEQLLVDNFSPSITKPFTNQVSAALGLSQNTQLVNNLYAEALHYIISEDSASRTELAKQYQRAYRLVKPEHFASVYGTDGVSEYNSVFGTKGINNKQRIAVFGALTQVSPDFALVLNHANVDKDPYNPSSLRDQINSKSNWLLSKVYQITANKPKSDNNTKTFVRRLMHHTAQRHSGWLGTTLNISGKTDDWIKNGNEKMANGVKSAMVKTFGSKTYQQVGKPIFNYLGNRIGDMAGVPQNIRKLILTDPSRVISGAKRLQTKTGQLGLIASLFNTMVKPNAEINILGEHVRKKGQKVEAAPQYLRDNLPSTIQDTFSNLSAAQSTALTRTLMQADLAKLHEFAGAETFNAIFQDPNKIAQLKKDSEDYIRNNTPSNYGHFLVNQAKGLGKFMATGQTHIKGQLNNARVITEYGNLLTEAKSDIAGSLTSAVDTLASLEALETFPQNTRDTVAAMLANTKDAKAIASLVNQINELRMEDRQKGLGDAKYTEIKGHMLSITNPDKALRVVDSEKGIDTAERQGYVPIEGSFTDISDNPFASNIQFMVNPNVGRTPYQPGAYGITNTTTSGIDVITGRPVMDSAKYYSGKDQLPKLLEIQKGYYNDLMQGSVDTSKPVNGMMPTVDGTGKIRGFYYAIPHQVRDSNLDRDLRVEQIIGHWKARNLEETATKTMNETLTDSLVQFYEDNKNDPSIQWVKVESTSRDRRVREAYKLLPSVTRKYIKQKTGNNYIMLPNSTVRQMLGQRAITPASILGDTSKDYIRMVNEILDEVFGKTAVHTINRGYRGLTDTVTYLKDCIVVRGVNTGVSNVVSNITSLRLRGVPIDDIAKYASEGMIAARRYRKLSKDILGVQQQMYAGENLNVLQSRLEALESERAELPIARMIEMGALPSIAEDMGKADNQFDNEFYLDKKIKALMSGTPNMVQTVVSNALALPESDTYNILREMVELGDFVAKYAYTQHLINNDGVSEDAAITKANLEYVSYAELDHPIMEMMNSLGVSHFTKYMFRITFPVFDMIAKKPLTMLTHMTMRGTQLGGYDNLPSPDEGSVLQASIGGHIGMLDLASGFMSNPISYAYDLF